MSFFPRIATIALCLALGACSTNDPVLNSDGGSDAHVEEIPDEGVDSGPQACTAIGTYTCSGGGGVECCDDGFLHEFVDGPCWSGTDDGGVADCTTNPESVGCPCATEGEDACRLYQASLICESGVWTVWAGHVCC